MLKLAFWSEQPSLLSFYIASCNNCSSLTPVDQKDHGQPDVRDAADLR